MSYIVKLHGRAFLAVRNLGKYEFYWDMRPSHGLQFVSKNAADLTMMTVRSMRPELFPTCLPEDARVVEFEQEYQVEVRAA